MQRLKVITAPFSLIGLPSLEVASLKAFLIEKGMDVEVEHVYIQFANYIGGEKYKILRMTDVGESIFSALLFPELYDQNKAFSNELLKDYNLSFDFLYNETKNFMAQYIENIDIRADDIVLFYMYTQQLLPSLYLAKQLKDKWHCHIWLGGYHCKDATGQSLQNAFSFIDRVFAEEIEEALWAAFCPSKAHTHEDLDFLPTPDYSDFFLEVSRCTEEFQEQRAANYSLQVEFSRGCWWNQCAFCTLNCRTNGFRERAIEKIIQDYKTLQEKHMTTQIAISLFVNNRNWQEMLLELARVFPGLYYTYHLNFKVSELLNPSDFQILKDTHTAILVGTESFSLKYLQKLNKGQSVIENIQVLKFAERNQIPCYHNLMFGLPFETEAMYEESKENIEYIYHLIPPFDLEPFRLTYGSTIYNAPETYGIKHIQWRKDKEAIFFPESMKGTIMPFFYDFETYEGQTKAQIENQKLRWNQLIQDWREIYYSYATYGVPKHQSLLKLYYNDCLIQVCDERYDINGSMYTFKGESKEIYLYCDQIRTWEQISQKFSALTAIEIKGILEKFIQLKIMFCEENRYLSLAI